MNTTQAPDILARLDELIREGIGEGLKSDFDKRLLASLALEKRLSPDQLKALTLLYLQPDEKRSLMDILIDGEYLKGIEVHKHLAHSRGYEFIEIDPRQVDQKLVKLIPSKVARDQVLFPYKLNANQLQVIVQPNSVQFEMAHALSQIPGLGKYQLELVASDPVQIANLIQQHYSPEAEPEPPGARKLEPETGPSRQLFANILNQAVEAGADSIHLEPQGQGLVIRFRIDGTLHLAEEVAGRYKDSLIAILKLAFDMDLSERRKPQWGLCRKLIKGRNFELRATLMPSIKGEHLVIKLREQKPLSYDLKQLGMDQEAIERLPQSGLVVISGQAGAGKTTSYYAMLEHYKSEALKLISIEDQVETPLDGILQVTVDNRETVKRSQLDLIRYATRIDPDIIGISEIRDKPGAETAARTAAHSGQLVITSMFTSSATAVPVQLMRMGVYDWILADALSLVISQRLVRLLCSHCKLQDPPPSELGAKGSSKELEIRIQEAQEAKAAALKKQNYQLAAKHRDTQKQLEKELAGLRGLTYKAGPGCEHCWQGYKGRQAIYEYLEIDEKVKAMIANGEASRTDLDNYLKSQEVPRLYDQALKLVASGKTSIEEANRHRG